MPQSVWISHSGVKGMHWYQHMPHVLARMSERRRASREAKAEAKRNQQVERSKQLASKAVNKKVDVSSMSTEDLQKVVDRLTLEKRYYDLLKDLNPKQQSAASKLIKELAEHAVREIAKAAIGEKIDERYGKNKNSRKKSKEDDDD